MRKRVPIGERYVVTAPVRMRVVLIEVVVLVEASIVFGGHGETKFGDGSSWIGFIRGIERDLFMVVLG